jgi:hypothetical protein
MSNNFLDDFNATYYQRIEGVTKELWAIQEKLEEYPKSDWRASIAWEAIKDAVDKLNSGMFEAAYLPTYCPEKYKHWRDTHATDF